MVRARAQTGTTIVVSESGVLVRRESISKTTGRLDALLGGALRQFLGGGLP